MQPLNFIANYYGEKFGFYFTWLVNYTAWLLPLALVGLLFFMFQIVDIYRGNKEAMVPFNACKEEGMNVLNKRSGSIKEAETAWKQVEEKCLEKYPLGAVNLGSLDNEYNFYFMLIVAVWCTIFVENWKRKQNLIANKWMMRDFKETQMERPGYHANIGV